MPTSESSSQSRRRAFGTLAWAGALGVGTSLFVAGQYFEYWLRENDPAEHPLVELFVDHPVEMLAEKPALMARSPVLSVVLSGIALATLSLRLWLFAVAGDYRQCWTGVRRQQG
jgi:hypothetical protein